MLTIIQVGNDKASTTYVRNKMKAVTAAGMEAKHIALPETATTEDVICKIHQACESTAIIVQLPLPSHIDKKEVLKWIPPWKDIDGLAPHSPYKPLTPCAIMRWLKEKGVQLEGKNVTILGRSELVGKPLANMLIDAGATVTVCNSRTKYSIRIRHCVESDIVITAVGKPDTISRYDVNDLRDDQIFIDVGINRDHNGKLCGDISEYARHEITASGSEYTPVPGGVGKWTVRELVLRLAEMEGAKHENT